MTTFDDLEFKPRFNVTEYSALESISPAMYTDMKEATQASIYFSNGYGASILFGSMFYSDGIDTYELAVLDPNGLTYSTPITDDVLGYITKDEVTSALQQIEALPPYTET